MLNNLFGAHEEVGGGPQTDTAQKCIGRSELTRVLKIMLDGISQGVRAFIDEIRMPPFAVENSLSRNVPSILVFA